MNSSHRSNAEGLSIMDHVADETLPVAGLARYTALRRALIADGQDAESVVEQLSVFLWELMEGRSANGVH
jgi:hypothetical protein